MKTLLKTIIHVVCIALTTIPTIAQLKVIEDQSENSSIKVFAQARITDTGVKGYIKITNTTNRPLYIYGAGATVKVQKQNKQSDGTYKLSAWMSQSLKANNLFLEAGGTVTESISATDSRSSEYIDLKELKITFGTQQAVDNTIPENSFKLTKGRAELFTIDGIRYEVEVANYTVNGLSGAHKINTTLYATNTNAYDVRFENNQPVQYRMHYGGYYGAGEAKFKKIKAGKTEIENVNDVLASTNFIPTRALEITYLPGLEGISTGDQKSKIVVPKYAPAEPISNNTSQSSSHSTASTSSTTTSYKTSSTSGKLLLTSDLKAEIKVDGKSVGTADANSPSTIELEPGQHLMEIIPAAVPNKVISEVVTMAEGKQVVKQIKLRAQYGALEDKRIKQAAFDKELAEKKAKAEEDARLYRFELERKKREAELEEVRSLFSKRYLDIKTRIPSEEAYRDLIVFYPNTPSSRSEYIWNIDPQEITVRTSNEVYYKETKCLKVTKDSIITMSGVLYSEDFVKNVRSARISKLSVETLVNKLDKKGSYIHIWIYDNSEGNQWKNMGFYFSKDGSGRQGHYEYQMIGKKRIYEDIKWELVGNQLTVYKGSTQQNFQIEDFIESKVDGSIMNHIILKTPDGKYGRMYLTDWYQF